MLSNFEMRAATYNSQYKQQQQEEQQPNTEQQLAAALTTALVTAVARDRGLSNITSTMPHTAPQLHNSTYCSTTLHHTLQPAEGKQEVFNSTCIESATVMPATTRPTFACRACL
jgi:hypothetical protein